MYYAQIVLLSRSTSALRQLRIDNHISATTAFRYVVSTAFAGWHHPSTLAASAVPGGSQPGIVYTVTVQCASESPCLSLADGTHQTTRASYQCVRPGHTSTTASNTGRNNFGSNLTPVLEDDELWLLTADIVDGHTFVGVGFAWCLDEALYFGDLVQFSAGTCLDFSSAPCCGTFRSR